MTLETRILPGAALEVRDDPTGGERVVSGRLVAYNVAAPLPGAGYSEAFAPGCFRDALARPDKVKLYGARHAQAIGRGVALRDHPDGPYMDLRVSETAAGDEAYLLARDGVYDAFSVGFEPIPGSSSWNRDRTVLTHSRVRLRHVALTDLPVHESAAVTAVRDQETSMADPTPTPPPTPTEPEPAPTPPPPTPPAVPVVPPVSLRDAPELLELRDQIRRLEARAELVPAAAGRTPGLETRDGLVNYARVRLHQLAGETPPDLETRALADNITTDNAGVVPPAYSQELIGLINTARPFLSSIRRLPTPTQGLKLIMPKITQRPLVGKQATQKTAIPSRAVHTVPEEFDAETYAGGGDISLQLLLRSSPEFLALWWDLIAEAYAEVTDAAAITALLAEAAVVEGGALDPADPAWRGVAWANTYAATRGKFGPDTIWLTPQAAGVFLAAKDSTGRALYPFLNPQNAGGTGSASDGVGSTIDGLRPVIVPATAFGAQPAGADAMIGWSRGMAWAEDGTYRLRVTNVELLGEDVALAGIVWLAPLYPEAFTTFTIGAVGP